MRYVADGSFLMGIDIGTTGCKSIIFSYDGRILSSAYGEYKLYHREPNWSELNPEEVWPIVVNTIKASIKRSRVNPKSIEAVGTSVLGEAFFPVDKDGAPLYWSMTTYDARAEEQTKWWEENFGSRRMYQITGQPLSKAIPIYTLQKIQWLRENKPEIYKKAFKFLCWEDYTNLKLCGNAVTDYSVATRTMIFDIRRRRWSSEILEVMDMSEDLLPEAVQSGEVVGEVDRKASDETGLAEGTLVVAGGHDQPCGSLGAGIVESGPAMDATGTVECIGLIQRELTLRDEMRVQGYAVHCYVVPDKYFMFGFNPSGGVVLRWFRDNFAQMERREAEARGVDVYDILTSEASKAQAGSMKLYLLPYFEGSGTPKFDRKARGVLFGLTLAHTKREITRAILEGITFELRSNIEAIEGHGTPITELRAIGGGAKSRFWLQLKADITGRKVVAPDVTEAAALGAAILAGVGSKSYVSAKEAVKEIYREKEVFLPNDKVKEVYDKHYHFYRELHSVFKELFAEVEGF